MTINRKTCLSDSMELGRSRLVGRIYYVCKERAVIRQSRAGLFSLSLCLSLFSGKKLHVYTLAVMMNLRGKTGNTCRLSEAPALDTASGSYVLVYVVCT